MAKSGKVLSFQMDIKVEQREGYWAARTDPLAITVYGKTESSALARARKAVDMLLADVIERGALKEFLQKRQVHHFIGDEPPRTRHETVTITRSI